MGSSFLIEVRSKTVEQVGKWIGVLGRGIKCKELEDKCFLFTFHEATRKRKALKDGPWMISKEALVVADFDGSKSLDEIDFSFISI